MAKKRPHENDLRRRSHRPKHFECVKHPVCRVPPPADPEALIRQARINEGKRQMAEELYRDLFGDIPGVEIGG